MIAALKLRTRNKQGRHLSTRRAIELLEHYGVETPHGLVRVPRGVLHKTTVDVYLRRWHLDQSRLIRQPPAVRFQAEFSNACWQFDMSPSDLKQVEAPLWIEPGRGAPTLMVFSVVDDRSGVGYQEYRCVYGEDAESALRFLFNAMASKPYMPDFPFQGIPGMLYMDCGPVSKRRVFHNVMDALGVLCQTHMPAGKDGRRVTARSKGKVERPFRTVKDMHETLYHFHRPENEAEANLWLQHYLLNYNRQPHRTEPHSRLDDWLANLPAEGFREMCSWEQFCRFAREPERRKVGPDARISVDGTAYQVDPGLAGETVLLLWGLFDTELYVEYEGVRFGPYAPVSGPIPLNRYRSFKKTDDDEKADRIRELADQLGLPIAALTGESDIQLGSPARFSRRTCRGSRSTRKPWKTGTRTESPPSWPSLKRSPCPWSSSIPMTAPSSTGCWPRPWCARWFWLGSASISATRKPEETTMRAEVMDYYGLIKPLNRAGYYETEHHGQMLKNVRGAILEGRIVALCGVIGSGKTVTLRRLQQQLKEENKITVSRSLAVDKHSCPSWVP